MNDELEIPDAALDAGARAAVLYVAESDALEVTADVLDAAAPLVVAAELDRLANDLLGVMAEMRTVRNADLGEGISRLRARAAQLRGAG